MLGAKILRPLLAIASLTSITAGENVTATSSSSTAASVTVEVVAQTSALSTALDPTVSAEAFTRVPPKWYLEPSSIPNAKGNLSQSQTNGKSLLGSLAAPMFGKVVGGDGSAIPWGSRTAANTNPYHDYPDTGRVRHYDWTIARSTLAPDGVEKPVILINGEYPGPTIEADWGDTIEVTVHNDIADIPEGTLLHWHGFLQSYTNFEDGVPGITQCPIAPGQSFTYSFKASLYGTSWYHSHFSAQYVSGTFGAIVIHGPTDNAKYDIDLGPVLLTDYYHEGYYPLVQQTMGTDITKIVVRSDNNLINGKGIMNCSLVTTGQPCTPDAGLAHFSFQPGKTHRLRLINAGAEGTQKFSIDNHKLTVIAVDFVPIEPREATIITLGVGQRTDVLVTADQDTATSFWMRSNLTCANAGQPVALGIVTYNGTMTKRDAPYDNSTCTNTTTAGLPTTTPWPDTTNPCANDDLSLTVPYFPITPPSNPSITTEIDVALRQNETNYYLFTMNNSTFRADYNNPILQGIQAGKLATDFGDESNIYNFSTAKSIRLVVNNQTPIVHPMHIHGHNMYVLSSTGGAWDGSIVNPSNPTRRDTQILEPNGSIVIQIDADNPGVWPFHCHIAWHVSLGLYVNILERPDDIVKNLDRPESIKQLCDGWDQWTSTGAFVNEIDSGLRMMEKARLRDRQD